MFLSQWRRSWSVFIVFIGIVMGLWWFGSSMNKEIERIDHHQQWESQRIVAPPQQEESAQVEKNQEKEEIIRKMRLDPNRKFSESIIFRDGQEIARFKMEKRKMYDFTGYIPNGKVKFFNESKKRYGTEHYQDDKLHGPYKEYLEGDILIREAYYSQGELIRNKEYFADGTLKMEENYEDALRISENDEVGHGKIYFRDGALMYEWYLTNNDPNRFKRTFNHLGELVADDKYNEVGELVSKWRKPRADPTADEDANVPK